MSNRRRAAALAAGVVALGLVAMAGCSEEKNVAQAPITPEMEKQAEASSNFLMEQQQKKDAQK